MHHRMFQKEDDLEHKWGPYGTNYLIGKRIYEKILTTKSADYGKQIIKALSLFLTKAYGGGGFDLRNLYCYVRFFKSFADILNPMSSQSLLSCSRYRCPLYEEERPTGFDDKVKAQ